MGKEPVERQVNPLGKQGWGGGCRQRLQLGDGGPGSLGVICVQGNWCPSWLPAGSCAGSHFYSSLSPTAHEQSGTKSGPFSP